MDEHRRRKQASTSTQGLACIAKPAQDSPRHRQGGHTPVGSIPDRMGEVMKKSLFAVALAASAFAFAPSTSATTFPTLTTIYVGSGVFDSGGTAATGEATSIHCSNVSGVSVQVRALILGPAGAVEGSLTQTLAHGATVTFSTHQTTIFSDADTDLATGVVPRRGQRRSPELRNLLHRRSRRC
jgi:hypothetical protein